jgi:alpha/beta superfamily hydrolase
MMAFCCGLDDILEGNDSASSSLLQAASPPSQCDGYPYAMLPQVSPEQAVDFYLPVGDNDQLACSLLMHTTASAEIDNAASNITKNTNARKLNFDSMDKSKPVIILCHGYASWRNQLLVAHLAGGLFRRGYHTLRFDFRGNGHSTGVWRYSNYDGEYQDLISVLKLVQQQLQCRVACIVGHSKGVATILRRALEQHSDDDTTAVPCFVNMSGRYSLPGVFDLSKRLTHQQIQEYYSTGHTVVAQKGLRNCILTCKDVQQREILDSSIVKNISSSVAVLTVHGSKDEVVTVENAQEFEKTIQNHKLWIIEGADHNYNGLKYMKELVEIIASFVDKNST